jgi:ubiquinone/menaquinone biosynthesis C-methylase UbiE
MTPKPTAAGKSSFDLVNPQKVFAELNLQSDSVLLDVACGIGNYAIAAADFIDERGAIHAVDLWAEGIASLQRRVREMGLTRIHAEVADVGRQLPLTDASADVALLATVLHDLAPPSAFSKSTSSPSARPPTWRNSSRPPELRFRRAPT